MWVLAKNTEQTVGRRPNFLVLTSPGSRLYHDPDNDGGCHNLSKIKRGRKRSISEVLAANYLAKPCLHCFGQHCFNPDFKEVNQLTPRKRLRSVPQMMEVAKVGGQLCLENTPDLHTPCSHQGAHKAPCNGCFLGRLLYHRVCDESRSLQFAVAPAPSE